MLSSSVPGRRNLRSADNLQLVVPDFKSTKMQRRGFAVAGPLAWNSLKPTFRGRFAGDESSAAVFKGYARRGLSEARLTEARFTEATCGISCARFRALDAPKTGASLTEARAHEQFIENYMIFGI